MSFYHLTCIFKYCYFSHTLPSPCPCDWWTFALAFDANEEQLNNLRKYEFSGDDDLGVSIESKGKRVVVSIFCRVDSAYIGDSYDEYREYEEDENEEESTTFVAEDELLNLLVQMRQQLMNADYRALYVVWEKYGGYDDEE